MQTYYAMLISGMCTPLIILLCGLFMYKHPPKTRNSVIGYRTSASNRSDESWLFAQKYCGKLWLILGAGMIVLTGVVFLLLPNKDERTASIIGSVVIGVQTALMLLSIIPVEIAIRKYFDKDGKRKE